MSYPRVANGGTGLTSGTSGGVPDLSTGHTGGGGCGCYVAARSGTPEPWAFFAIGLTLGLALLRRRAFTAPR